MRKITMAAFAAVALLLAGCGDDDETASGGDDVETAAEDTSSATSEASEDTAESGGDSGDGDAGTEDCPDSTRLHAVTETTYEGDEEVLAEGTEFPAAHFTLDLDGSGFGPVLSGVFSTEASEDVASMTHANPDAPPDGVRRVEVILEGPAEGETEFPLGVYDVTFADGKVDATEGMGLAQLDIVEGSSAKQARNFTELELTHIGDDVICGEFRPVDRSDDTSQAPTWVEGEFVASYSEQP